MRAITALSFGFALTASAFALAIAPASAVETPVASATLPGNFTKVDDREHHERCERVRHECREMHHEHERRFHRCMEEHHC